MGLGCGGPSRLGMRAGGTEGDAERVVREALDFGINFIDTAEAYRTEEVVGRAIRGRPREQIVLSSKVGVRLNDRNATAAETKERIEASLRRLGTDHVDVFHLHGVSANEYAYARDELLPAFLDLQAEGKIRFIGITEAFGPDPGHATLSIALRDPYWDVVMVGFNLLNQSALGESLRRPGTTGSARCVCSQSDAPSASPDVLKNLMAELAEQNLVDAGSFNPEEPLGFLLADGAASSLPEAAYRYCKWEPGIDVVLSGTGSIEHLRENAAALAGPPLPNGVTERLKLMFARVDFCVCELKDWSLFALGDVRPRCRGPRSWVAGGGQRVAPR